MNHLYDKDLVFKYFDPKTALIALENSSLCFSKLKSFNDPFEAYSGFARSKSFDNFINFNDRYGVLCLTRSPNNILMWAHYCTSFGGVVVGYDRNSPFFERDCVVPLSHGDVIYTNNVPHGDFLNSEWHDLFSGSVEKFDPTYLVALKRFFLFKMAAWSYEEEVRVVKNFKSLRGGEVNDGQGKVGVINAADVKVVIFGSEFIPCVECVSGRKLDSDIDVKRATIEWLQGLSRYQNCKFYQLSFGERIGDLIFDGVRPGVGLMENFRSKAVMEKHVKIYDTYFC